ncbi:MFS general substrate transporter [Mycena albidolilacea]|uniref:MFS general substrate transporter n=1 Tax=Mycena albidolilacea TaxID=1033008 RepID=A0AAD7EKJ1_9AGAR|nr:MFS general substrate transporter [Mycena albidolilacea]
MQDPSSPRAGSRLGEHKAATLDTAALKTSPSTPENSRVAPTAATFPEGGLRAWATVAGAFLVQFCGVGYTTSYGVYQDFYTRDYLTHSSSSAISWIGSINAFIVISGGLITGRLYDRGYFYHLMWGGGLLQCFSLFMLSFCKHEQWYQIFLAQGLGVGIGAGTIYTSTVALISHYFQKRRALAMTIASAGTSLGAVVHPIMLNNTFSRLGFANAVRASAGLISGFLLIACLLMHPRLPPPTTHVSFWKSLRRFAHDLPYVLSILAMTTYTVGLYFVLFYLQLDSVTHGINQSMSFYSLVILNASGFVGRLSYGVLGPRLGIFNMITAAAAIGAIMILCMIALKSIASVVVIALIFGYSAGMFIALTAPLMAALTDDLGELGLRIGVGFVGVGVGGLIGPPIHGALLTSRFEWWRPALFSGIMALISVLFFIGMLIAIRRKKKDPALSSEKQQEQVAA